MLKNISSQSPQKDNYTYDPQKHHRHSIRLKGYDYSQAGLYFITMCCQNRACLFGEIKNGQIILNEAGFMENNEWLKLTERFPNIRLHEFIVMPNHLHSILEIVECNIEIESSYISEFSPKKKTVGNIVGAFSPITTVQYIPGVKNNNWPEFAKRLWQRNYWEHIIRNQKAYENISQYIINNPAKWKNDSLQ